MQHHEFSFEIEASRDEVWYALHPRPRPRRGLSGERRVLEHGGVRIEIINEGDDKGEGLVRTCTYRVPRLLLSGGVGRSWECVTEVRPPEFSRYEAVGKPLWSEASGWHRLEELDGGRTRVEFGETYHAFNPVLRLLLERYVHRFISRDNDRLVRTAVEQGVARARSFERQR
ncbi:MAG: SRPBCC family protein [Actinomycetota bacterium]|nr:SRPBCC family protein [Actinomycetota bacterium]